mmetsp:Transcript_23139/g.50150  ORF Transcript_23139/g.50150 Transcript_23139/m.50150 type:complete len:349 (-) Transcript_23139:129-1175(-)
MPAAAKLSLLVILVSILECSFVGAVANHQGGRSASTRSRTVPQEENVDTKHSGDETIADIVTRVRRWQMIKNALPPDKLPFVSLAYAQSLDGCVAVVDSSNELSSNLPLSGEESLLLTHGLRSIHDAILVGGNTFAVDNPRLSIRLWPHKKKSREKNGNHTYQPKPVVLDTELTSLRILLSKHGGEGIRAQNPIICCAQDVFDDINHESDGSLFRGADILPCKRDTASSKGLDLGDVLKQLRERRGIKSVMVEGGAATLAAFANKRYVDCICITIAPKLIGGRRGVSAFGGFAVNSMNSGDEHDGNDGKSSISSWCNFDVNDNRSEAMFISGIGSDCIFLAKWPKYVE